MKFLKKWLLGSKDVSMRDQIAWNMAASLINASEAVIILMIATRVLGVSEAGILTIAFAVANMMMCIGKFGVRTYQVTDTEGEYGFSDYHFLRILTLFLMFAGTIGYSLLSALTHENDGRRGLVIFLVCLIYGTESYEDVYLSELQRAGRLDIGNRMFVLRWAAVLVIWGIMIILEKSAVLPIFCAFLGGFFVELLCLHVVRGSSYITAGHGKPGRCAELMKRCLPLCITAFAGLYLPNAAKYTLDLYAADDVQACYGFIAMPVFVIDLLSMIVFQPILKQLAEIWAGEDKERFRSIVGKLQIGVAVLAVVCVAGASWIGIPVLEILYGVGLEDYKLAFFFLMLGSAALAFIGIFYSVLVILRKQSFIMWSYAGVSLIGLLTLPAAVKYFSVNGAALETAVLLLLLCGILWRKMQKEIRHASHV